MIVVLGGFLLAFAESGLGLGAILPGEVAISALAASASGMAATLALGAFVALGAVAGDHLGFLIGRHGGSRLRETPIITRLGVGRWDRAAAVVRRYGFWGMYASRMLPVIRTVMPFVAGAAGLRYRTFLLASVLGAVTWSAMWVGAGSAASAIGILDHPEFLVIPLAIGMGYALDRLVVHPRRTCPREA